MNWAEKAYFTLFVLWTRKRKDRDIAGLWTLLTLFLGLWFNIVTLLLLTIVFNSVDYNLPPPPNRLIMMSSVILLIGLIAVFLMRKDQRAMYRNKLLSMSLVEIKRTSRNALIYVVGTLLSAIGIAILTVNVI